MLLLFLDLLFAIIKTSPPLTIEAVTDLDQASQLFDADGEFMDEVLKAEKRYVISLDEMPLQLRNAFIAIEDEKILSTFRDRYTTYNKCGNN